MKQEFVFRSNDGVTDIHTIEWLPEGAPKAVLQICHGMVEYIDRYDRFASFLAQQGFYVVGNDHLGHGKSVQNDDMLGYFHETHGNEYVIGDIHALRTATQKKYPDIPYFMLGHSMGSFLLRQYIEMHGEGLAGAIIMGTGTQPALVLKTAKFLCKRIAASKGWTHRSSFINGLALGSYNKKFQPARTNSDWLSRDTEVVDKYISDPWCTFTFTLNSYYHMFRGIEYLQDPQHIRQIPKDLPLLLVSGSQDPVGGFGQGVKQAYDGYIAAGIKDVQMKLYPEDRHEILNELGKEQVYHDLLEWLLK